MSILKTEIGTAIPNFLDSEVGLVTKTAQIPQSMGQTDGDRKTVFAGTVFPANTSAATGIVFQDVDVTDGDAIGSIMVAGRVISDRVNAASAAHMTMENTPKAAVAPENMLQAPPVLCTRWSLNKPAMGPERTLPAA